MMKMFNPRDHFISLKGKQYLPVAARIAWFRDECPDWTVNTYAVPELSGADYCTFACEILDNNGRLIAKGHKTEHEKHFADYREKAETGAIGRALALCGFGTLFAQELEEPITPAGDMRIVDTPQPSKTLTLTPGKQFAFECKRIWGAGITPSDMKRVFFKLAGHNDTTDQNLRLVIEVLMGFNTPEEAESVFLTIEDEGLNGQI
jgi:hypothetical protein